MHNGYLLEIGWFESWREKKNIDEKGLPIPWAPYPFIHFMKDYLKKDMIVFEFGSGSSTHFFSNYCSHVYSVEHNKSWSEDIKSRKPDNVTIIDSELNDSYEKSIHSIDRHFDIIYVDGRRRVNCIRESAGKIEDNGIIVLDDSDREEYREAFDLLEEKMFRHVTFQGIKPLGFIKSTTTIFFKDLRIGNE
jgi:hypothetical protein